MMEIVIGPTIIIWRRQSGSAWGRFTMAGHAHGCEKGLCLCGRRAERYIEVSSGMPNQSKRVSKQKLRDSSFGASPPDDQHAGVAQLAEHQLPKLNVEGSNPFARSFLNLADRWR